MPPWSVHAKYSARFLRRLGIGGIDPSLVDRLVDAPSSLLPTLRRVLERRDKLLALLLYDDRLRPLDPLCIHDWGAWRGQMASIEALRRVAEIVWGLPGVLLVDLHLSLDYAWKCRERREFVRWAESVGISEEVKKFLEEVFEELMKERELQEHADGRKH